MRHTWFGTVRRGAQTAFHIIRRSMNEYMAHDGGMAAAAIAYYALLSIFPLLLGTIIAASFFIDPQEARERIFAVVGQAFPISREMIESIIADLIEARGPTGLLSLAALLWSGSRIFDALRTSLNRAWGVADPRGYLFQQVFKASLLIITILAMFALVFLSATARVVAALPIPFLGIRLADLPLWNIGLALVPLLGTFLVLLALYRFVPAGRVDWTAAALGAAAAAVLIEVAKQGFYFFVFGFGEYSMVYGPLAGGVIFLIWTYFLGVILIYGAEFGKAAAEAIWGPAPPQEVAAPRARAA